MVDQIALDQRQPQHNQPDTRADRGGQHERSAKDRQRHTPVAVMDANPARPTRDVLFSIPRRFELEPKAKQHRHRLKQRRQPDGPKHGIQ